MSSTQSQPLPGDNAVVAEIESRINETMATHQLPGFAIGVVRAGQVLYTGGFGSADLDTGRPVTSASLFCVASVSKSFTSIAIMQLVEEGKMDLDARLTEYLPYFRLADPRYVEITIRQLLSNTSGLPAEPDEIFPPVKFYNFENPDKDDEALERFVRSLSGVHLLTAPDSATFHYSNIGFDILGDVIAKASGQSYEAYIRKKVLMPLGMEKSTFLLDEADGKQLVRGYQRNVVTGEVTAWPFFPFDRRRSPCDGLITNVADLSQAALTLLNGGERQGSRILKSESLAALWSPVTRPGTGGFYQGYGLGWIVADIDGHHFAWHTGSETGFEVCFILAPQDGVAVTALVNSFRFMADDETRYAVNLGTSVMKYLLGIEE